MHLVKLGIATKIMLHGGLELAKVSICVRCFGLEDGEVAVVRNSFTKMGGILVIIIIMGGSSVINIKMGGS
jgi:hypothetical protein